MLNLGNSKIVSVHAGTARAIVRHPAFKGKTTDWVKPKNTKLFFQLRPTPAAIHQICWVGWCQGTSIPVPKS